MKIRKATTADIALIEDILLEAVKWLDSIGKHGWNEEDVKWESLSLHHSIEHFYIMEKENEAIATFLLADEDPIFWKELPKGESLYIHKLCVRRKAAKSGASVMILDFFKNEAKRLGMDACRLDCKSHKPELRHFYESQGFELVDEGYFVPTFKTCRYIYRLK